MFNPARGVRFLPQGPDIAENLEIVISLNDGYF